MGLFKKILGTKEKEKVEIDPIIYSPLTGKVVPLRAVNDPVFSQEMMGQGAAVIPTVGRVVAPCDGEVISVFKTLHALTIKADNGAEIIVHVGLETVALNGQYYKSHVGDGERIKKGDLLLTFDLDQIKTAGYDVITPVIVTNSTDYQCVEKTNDDDVNEGDILISLGNN
jgi:PTS system beta-glucosides-specific IIC component